MKYKIVSDSSSDLLSLSDVEFSSVPLKIIFGETEYIDDKNLNLEKMVSDLRSTSQKSGTSCPNPNDWLEAFGDAENIFAITITSALSGSYNSLIQAKQEFVKLHPDANIYTIDSLSTGPEMRLIIEKIKACILKGDAFDEICKTIETYQSHTHLLFCLQSLRNLANNGRVNPTAAKIAGILGIRIVGLADEQGKLNLLHKCRGEKKAVTAILNEMKKQGYNGGNVRISHCFNPDAANALSNMISAQYPDSNITIQSCTGLCSFYAEYGGILIGYEDSGAE